MEQKLDDLIITLKTLNKIKILSNKIDFDDNYFH